MLGNTRDSTCSAIFEEGFGVPRIASVRAIFDGDNAVLGLGFGLVQRLLSAA